MYIATYVQLHDRIHTVMAVSIRHLQEYIPEVSVLWRFRRSVPEMSRTEDKPIKTNTVEPRN